MTNRSILLAAAATLVAVATAAAQPFGEIPLSTPIYGPARGNSPAVATDGTNFLVAWNDSRALGSPPYAARVTADGTVLDGTGIRLPSPAMRVLGVFRMGGAYTVVCADANDVVTFRIDDNGQITDGPVTVSNYEPVAAAASGTRIVLASRDEIAVLDDRGALLERNIAVPGKPNVNSVSLASNGTTFLLVTYVFRPTNAVTQYALDAGGHVTTSSLVGVSSSGGAIIGNDGTDYLAIYADSRSGITVVQRVGPDAVPRNITALPASNSAAVAGSLIWTGSTYLLVTTTTGAQYEISTATLDRNGNFITPLTTTGALGVVTPPVGTWNGNHVLMAWSDQLSGVDDEMLNADGTAASAPMTIPRSSNPQIGPVIATGGATDLAVWFEPPINLYASRISRSGIPLDGRGILVTQRVAALLASVAFDGNAYLVAWLTFDGVFGQRIDGETGALLGVPMKLAPCASAFDLGRDDAGLLLVASDCTDAHHIAAQRIGVAGPVGDPVPITPPNMPSGYPRIAWNGSEWLVVWEQLIPFPLVDPPLSFRGNVYAERLSSALVVRDAQPIPLAISDQNEGMPFVATDGRDFLVAWTHCCDTQSAMLRRVSADGTAGPAVALATGTLQPRSIVWDGKQFAIAYVIFSNDFIGDLFLTHVSADGHPLGDRVTISATGTDERDVSLVVPANGAVRAAYSRVAPEALYGGVSRVFLRDLITPARRRSAR